MSRHGGPHSAQQSLSAHWSTLLSSLSEMLGIFRANFVPKFLCQKFFTQFFACVNVQLFNSLLLRRECCSFSNGEYVKAGLTELEQWIKESTTEYAGSSWDELRFIRQAVGFLVSASSTLLSQTPAHTLTHSLTHFPSILR